MKKKISVLAAVLLVIGLTACGNNDGQVSADTIRMPDICMSDWDLLNWGQSPEDFV